MVNIKKKYELKFKGKAQLSLLLYGISAVCLDL